MTDNRSSWLGAGGTIAAIATAAGRGALATIRISGSGTRELSGRILHPPPTRHRQATHCVVRNSAGAMIDDVVATLYLAPRSFTGEDLLEISTHGGLVVPLAVLAAVLEAGAREAGPGEFTRRAVLNDKLDLLQAEAVGDLIEARSTAAQQAALRQLDGGLSRRIGALRERLLHLEAQLAYDIDFPEEDDGPVARETISESARSVQGALRSLLATAEAGALIHDGALVVLAGPPNAGKSSLFNALLGEARAIVTPVPGTTRDAIEAVLDLPNWPLRLVDTAGIHDTTDPVELLGIEASTRYLERADVVLACVDSEEATGIVADLGARTRGAVIVVATKADLVSNSAKLSADIAVSAHSGEGLRELLQAIEARLTIAHTMPTLDAPVLTRARQRAAVQLAETETEAFLNAWEREELPASVAATHVRAAADALGELIGAVHVDDVLDVVFRSFCVGK